MCCRRLVILEIYRSTQFFELPDHMIFIKKNSDPNFFFLLMSDLIQRGLASLLMPPTVLTPFLQRIFLPEFIYSEDFFKSNILLHRY